MGEALHPTAHLSTLGSGGHSLAHKLTMSDKCCLPWQASYWLILKPVLKPTHSIFSIISSQLTPPVAEATAIPRTQHTGFNLPQIKTVPHLFVLMALYPVSGLGIPYSTLLVSLLYTMHLAELSSNISSSSKTSRTGWLFSTHWIDPPCWGTMHRSEDASPCVYVPHNVVVTLRTATLVS